MKINQFHLDQKKIESKECSTKYQKEIYSNDNLCVNPVIFMKLTHRIILKKMLLKQDTHLKKFDAQDFDEIS
jgi:hypothetical protein